MNKKRIVIFLLGLGLLGLLIFLGRNELGEAVDLIISARWRWLVAAIMLAASGFFIKARFQSLLFEHFGYRIALIKLVYLNGAMFFINMSVPSVGIPAISYLSAVLRQDGVPAGKTSSIEFSRYAVTYVSYLLILVMAAVALLLAGNISAGSLYVIGLLAAAIVTVTFLILVVIRRRRLFDGVVLAAARSIDWISRKLRSGRQLFGNERTRRLLGDFHEGLGMIMRDKLYLKKPAAWALIANMAEVGVLYCIFLAIGFAINPGVVVATYALANASSLFSFVPGDIGIYELVMVGVLSTAGVPLAVAISATLLYRVLAKFAFLPFGFYSYTKFIKEI